MPPLEEQFSSLKIAFENGTYHATLKPIPTSYRVDEDSNYGGSLKEVHGYSEKNVYITKVLYNNPATIVFWNDGTQTRNICPKGTEYNPDTGLTFCVLKKLMSSNGMARLFEDWELKDCENDINSWVGLKDVRRAHKEKEKE